MIDSPIVTSPCAFDSLPRLRKALKPLGFDLKAVKQAWGRHVIYTNLVTGEELSCNVFTPATREKWATLFSFIIKHESDLLALGEKEGLYGLIKG